MQGASAIEKVLGQQSRESLHVFVVWEPVLPMDWLAVTPTTGTMKRVSDLRVHQFWDRGRLLSKAMGEGAGRSVVWDWVGVYGPEAVWESSPPKPEFAGGPVVRVLAEFTRALARLAPTR